MANIKLMPLNILSGMGSILGKAGLGKISPLNNAYHRLLKSNTPREVVAKIPNDGYEYEMALKLNMGGIPHEILAGTFETKTSELFRKYTGECVSNCRSVVDVGANIGYYTLLAASMGVPVYAFEPDNNNLIELYRNIVLNCDSKVYFPKVTVFPFALSDRIGTEFFNHSNAECGAHSLLKIPSREIDSISMVPTITLDYVYDHFKLGAEFGETGKRLHIGGTGLIKVDVEGAEVRVLRGAENTIRANKPVMFVECWPEGLQAAGDSVQGLFDWLASLGYRVKMIDEFTKQVVATNPIAVEAYYEKHKFSVNLMCKFGENGYSE